MVDDCVNTHRADLLEQFVHLDLRMHPGTPGAAPDTVDRDRYALRRTSGHRRHGYVRALVRHRHRPADRRPDRRVVAQRRLRLAARATRPRPAAVRGLTRRAVRAVPSAVAPSAAPAVRSRGRSAGRRWAQPRPEWTRRGWVCPAAG